MNTIYCYTPGLPDAIDDFLEVQNIDQMWTGYTVQFGYFPATFHLTRDEAVDWLDMLKDEYGMNTENAMIMPVQMPSIKKIINYWLNTYKGKGANLEFGRTERESK